MIIAAIILLILALTIWVSITRRHPPSLPQGGFTSSASPSKQISDRSWPSTSPKFHTLLLSIRTHILSSPSTLEAYLLICDYFNTNTFRNPSLRITHHSIRDRFRSHWPEFWPLDLPAYHEGGILGRRRMREVDDGENKVRINPALVCALEDAPEVCTVTLNSPNGSYS
jgi:hypothetical protein